MSDSTAVYSAMNFGSSDANPRILSAYSSVDGWVRPAPHRRLSEATAEALRAEGHTMAIVRWRLHTEEVLLSRYLGR